MTDTEPRQHNHQKPKSSFWVLCGYAPALSLLYGLLLLLVFDPIMVNAQKDTSRNVSINISANSVYFVKTDSGAFNRFIDNAVFIQGTDTLYCDSLYQNNTTKNIEAFSNVRIHQMDGTTANSDYLRYTSSQKLAYMHSNVVLVDGTNVLRCQDLTYDLTTKTGVYTNGGTLKTDSSTVTSQEGEYMVKSKDARFRKKVKVVDVRYDIVSDDLGYNTGSRVVTFYSPSIVTSDSGRSQLKASNGTYESASGTAHFIGHSSVVNDEHYLEGDSIFYNKSTGYGFAQGHVISIDTARHSTLFCDHLEYFKIRRVMWATGKPVLKQVNGKDTLYMRADTFYSFPDPRPRIATKMEKTPDPFFGAFYVLRDVDTGIAQPTVPKDTLTMETPWFLGLGGHLYSDVGGSGPAVKKPGKTDTLANSGSHAGEQPGMTVNTMKDATAPKQTQKKSKKKEASPKTATTTGTSKSTVPSAKETPADTTAPLMFVGYHHVLIFSDSMQGKCDSVTYSQADSTIKMIYKPVAWSHLSQITGDTILIHLDDSGHPKTMFVPNNSFVISQSGPEKAQLFDQVQGKTLTVYFEHSEINHLVVVPDAQSIYYSKDGKGAYVGESEAKSERMRIFFEKQQIKKILFEKDITQTMTPLEKLNIHARLSRFSWQMDTRPKSKEELFK